MDEDNEENRAQEMQKEQAVQEKPAFEQPQKNVSFPTVTQETKSGGPKTILIAGTLILVAVLGFVVYKSATKKAETTTGPTPFENTTFPSNETTPVSTPVATATASAIDRKSVSISILNGTGIAGEAAYLQTQLQKLGYSDIKAGNASSQDATTTTVVFSKDVSTAIVTEITQELNSVYQKATSSTSSSATTDVVITTGLRKGATAKPSATPTATPKASATPTSSPSASPTATP